MLFQRAEHNDSIYAVHKHLFKVFDAQALEVRVEERPTYFESWKGYHTKQIATVAEIPVGTVMSRLGRARKRLQRRLGSHGNEESTTRLAVGTF